MDDTNGDIFERPVSPENIFILDARLRSAPQNVINEIFADYVRSLDRINKSRVTRSPELLASQGVYLCLLLRYKPDKNLLYVSGEHYLIVGLKAYYPYISMYIQCYLIPNILEGCDLEVPASEVKSPSNDITSTTLENVRKMNPKNASKFGMSAIDKLIDACSLGSGERKLLGELRRLKDSSPGYLMTRTGLKEQRQEMAIFLDRPELLDEALSEDDIQKAIFMHSNRVLMNDVSFMPHHFDRAVQCLNYDIAKHTSSSSDWVEDETLDNLVFMCKEVKHALCLSLLLLVVRKNVILCTHHMKRLPEEWREQVMEVYTTPRWKECRHDVGDRAATLEYYRANLCSTETGQAFITAMQSLAENLKDKETCTLFTTNLRSMNMSYYILHTSGYLDFTAKDKSSFANVEDSGLNDIFDLSRNFVFPYREGNKIYLFDYNVVGILLEKKENIYNRERLSLKFLEDILARYQQYNTIGIGTRCSTMTDFIRELIYGREVAVDCPCGSNKNYIKKLARTLRHYSIKEESFEPIQLDDIMVKFALISIDLSADTVGQLCEKLYKSVKVADPQNREALKRTISSIILIYSSRSAGGFTIEM